MLNLDQIKNVVRELEYDEFGVIEFENRNYVLTEKPWPAGYYSVPLTQDKYESEMTYYADAVGDDGFEYSVEWETTQEWNEAYAYPKKMKNFDGEEVDNIEDAYEMDYYEHFSGDAFSCDWEHPISITKKQ